MHERQLQYIENCLKCTLSCNMYKFPEAMFYFQRAMEEWQYMCSKNNEGSINIFPMELKHFWLVELQPKYGSHQVKTAVEE